jgi:hypothetical protein
MLGKYVRKLDGVSKEEHHGNLVGGMVSIVGYILVLVYLIMYLTSSVEKSYPVNTEVVQFPNEQGKALTLPPINCVATNGCYIKSQALSANCLYLAQGEALPLAYRKLYYTSDPNEMFTVLSTNSGENFAISFDFETVTKYADPLETETLAAATNFDLTVPMPYKVHRGLNTFNLIRTVAVDGTEVDTWSAQLTQDVSSFKGSGGCCGTNVVDKDGASYGTGTTRMGQCSANYNNNNNDWWTIIMVPPATYSEVTVLNPLDGFTILGLIGGWVSIAMAILAVLYHLLRDTGIIDESSVYFKTEEQVEAADKRSIELSTVDGATPALAI